LRSCGRGGCARGRRRGRDSVRRCGLSGGGGGGGGGSGGGVWVHVGDLAVDSEPGAEALLAAGGGVGGAAGTAPGLVGALVDLVVGAWEEESGRLVRGFGEWCGGGGGGGMRRMGASIAGSACMSW